MIKVTFLGIECDVELSKYSNGQPCIQLWDPENGPMATATAAVSTDLLKEGETTIKDYSENKGILDALVQAGVVSCTGQSIASGYVDLKVVHLIEQSSN